MYDFKALSDYDFEILSKDLLQKYLNCHLEAFKKGRDGGIDLRYSCKASRDIIVQCKHYANSSFNNLKSNLTNAELPKIKKLLPKRYILITSLGLTPQQKDDLFTILSPYCQSTGDILGNDEINGLLRTHPDIEKSHYKLWLTSSTVLDRVVHSAVYGRSEITIARIQEKLQLYVQNKSFFTALKILHELNYCIISGIPGIGKSTLAEVLLVAHLDMGFEVIKISQNIEEAFQVYSSGKKQIFFYDDFLGQTGLDIKLSKNEDNDILEFINYIRKNNNSKFILTTREYILNQAKATYESLARSDFDIKKCTLLLSDYTKLDKAKILYNHIYFKKLPQKYIDNLLENNITSIVNHPNYNPRIIEIITTRLLPTNPQVFFKQIMYNLNNPTEIWRIAFEKQISDESRNLLLLLVSLPPRSKLTTVKEIFNHYHSEKSKIYLKSYSDNDFKNALRELDGNFIITDETTISFHNPSINDFLENYIMENDTEFNTLCNNAICFEQCVILYNLSSRTKHELINKYIGVFSEALLTTLYSFKFKGKVIRTSNNSLIDTNSSILKRILFLLEFNKVFQSVQIAQCINSIFENLATNFSLYGCTLKEYGELLTYISASDQTDILNESTVSDIRNYAIKKIQSYETNSLDDFRIFSIIEDYYPSLVNDDIISEIAAYFDEYQKDDIRSVRDWGHPDAIDDYSSSIEELGDYFNIDIRSSLHDLNKQKEDMEKNSDIEADDAYDRYRDNQIMSEVDDNYIKNMFDGLKS